MADIFNTDVLIVGGGPSGTSAALSILQHSSLSVILTDNTAFDVSRVGEHVDASLFKLLSYLEIEKDDFEADSFIEGYNSLAAWGNEVITSRSSIHNPESKSFQLDREKFDLLMLSEITNRGGKIFPRTKCIQIEQLENDSWELQMKHQTKGNFTIRTKFLIDASGRQGHLCRMLNLKVIKYDQLVGISAFLRFREPKILPQEIFLETVKHGWWYSATLPGDRLVFTLFTDADIIKTQQLQKPGNWNKLLLETKHIGKRIQNTIADEQLWVRNAFSQLSDSSVKNNFLAIGDAAAAFDPISSMGIGFAVSSACNAARAIEHFFSSDGDDSYIRTYQEDLKTIFGNYLNLRKQYYHMEQRWAKELFWDRRI